MAFCKKISLGGVLQQLKPHLEVFHIQNQNTFRFWAEGSLTSSKKGLNKQSHSSFPSSFSYLLHDAAPSFSKDRISYTEVTATYGKKPQCTQVINYFPSDLLAVQEKNTYLPSCSSADKQKQADSGDGATFALSVSRNRFPCIAQHDFKRREIHERKIYWIIRPTISRTLIRVLI